MQEDIVESDFYDEDDEEQFYGGQFSKSWEELTFADNFLFCKIMEDESICREFIEILLPIKIGHIKYLNTEKEFHPSYKGRSIRLDVFLKDTKHIIDIEIQTTSFKNLDLRARYYQGAMDVATTKKRTKFSRLKESYVLFICKGDPFGCNLPVYTVRQSFIEKPDFEYNDKTHKVFYNCKAYNVADDEDLKGLLEFIQTNRASTKFSHTLEENVKIAKQNTKWEDEYMYFTDVLEEQKEIVRRAARKQGLKEGREEGINLGRQEGLNLGRKEARYETAKKAIKLGLSTEQITQLTGLTTAQIQELEKEE
ncbi:MAG: Rpn family recombination-promoting nuclease/putative transposase [Treponema sp.]|nr:Rpn family recombination-promoting nuclease/putative transposase [Treponema sp.]